MTKRENINSFWTGGHDSITSRLKAEEEEALQRLKKLLSQTQDKALAKTIKIQIKDIKREYKMKRKESDTFLYWGS